MRRLVILLIAVLVLVTGFSGAVTADPPHEGQDAKLGNGSDNAGHGNACDGDDNDNPGASEGGVNENARENRQSDRVHCPEDELR